jgi:hypothetical protein
MFFDPTKITQPNDQISTLMPEQQIGPSNLRGIGQPGQLSSFLSGAASGQMNGTGMQMPGGVLHPWKQNEWAAGSAAFGARPNPAQKPWTDYANQPGNFHNIDPYFNANSHGSRMPQAPQQPQQLQQSQPQPNSSFGYARVGPGMYRDVKTGKTMQSAQNPGRRPQATPGAPLRQMPAKLNPISMQGPAGGLGGMQNAMPGYLNQGQDRLNQQPYAQQPYPAQSPLVGALGGLRSGGIY